MAMLETGATAPDFTLADDRGGQFHLAAHRGRPVVVSFYCEDDSGGCVIENQEFSALVPEFEKLEVPVVAISPQDVRQSQEIRRQIRLPPAAARRSRACRRSRPMDVWQQKKLWGREFMGVVRVTYLIDAEGKIAGVLKASRIKGHAQKVLDAARALAAGR